MKQRIVFLFCLGILIVISLLSIAKQKNIDVQEIKQLPNLNVSEQTVGFTCTGMTYNHLDSCWYIGNIGAYHPNEGMKSSIIVMSKDFKQVEDSILLYKLFPDMASVQGIAIDETDNSIYFCSFEEKRVRHISRDLQSLDSLSISKPTGVAIDQATGHLWVLTFTDLIEYTKEFRQISTFPIHKDGQDQLAILNGKIYITHGLDYSKDQFVSVFDIATRRIDETYTVDKSYAIEGIAIVDSLVYIANDGLYHDAKIKRNQVNIYKLSNFN